MELVSKLISQKPASLFKHGELGCPYCSILVLGDFVLKYLGLGESSVVLWLSCKCKGLSWIPRTQFEKKKTVVICTCNTLLGV